MKKKISSNEWTKLREQESQIEEKLEAALDPLYTLQRSLDYCLSWAVGWLNVGADAGEDELDVAEPGTWYRLQEVVKHASKLIESGLEQSNIAHHYAEELRQLEILQHEIGAPDEYRAKQEAFRSEVAAKHVKWDRMAAKAVRS